MRLIDADKLHYHKVIIAAMNWTHKEAVVVFAKDIDKAETIDAVEVVRCKDCKRCDGFPIPNDIQQNEIGICKINMMAVKQNGFCSYGERKDGDE